MSKKLVHGVGINDADYVVKVMASYYEDGKRKRKLVSICPFYEKWKSMIDRCYSEKIKTKRPCYIGCSVCVEWLTFSNFKIWMEEQDWKGLELDKDLLGTSKIYSPETCIFIPAEINSFLTFSERDKPSGLLIGVHHKRGKFRAVIRDSGKYRNLGTFTTELEAHLKWYNQKLVLAETLKMKYSLSDNIYDLMIEKIQASKET